MKPLRSIAITVLGCLALPLFAQETPPQAPVGTISPPVLPSLAGTARILGKIPDGTPPPPAPPKPPFIVAPEHVRDTTAIQQGGRTITLQRIDPIALPPPPAPAAPYSAIDAAAFREKAAAYRATHPWVEFLALGATVYRNGTAPARTFVRYRPNGSGEEIQFWSSADFSLLASLPAFTDGQGRSYSLFLMWTSIDPARTVARLAALGRTYVPPQIPDLPGGAATFTLTTPPPADARLLAPIRALHELYTSQFPQLQTARADRERARLAREAELKAHPPQPQDLVIRHWRLGQGTPQPAAPTAPPPRRAAAPQPRRRPKRATPPPAVRLSRRPLLAVLSLLAVGLLAPNARAILDTNNDSMSDLWQTQFSAGNVLAGNDDDHDGWTNAMEAAAGTNPFDANPPAGIIRPAVIQTPAVYLTEGGITTLETPAAVSVTWPTVAGKLYTLRGSPDIIPGSWLAVDLPRIGTGTGLPMGNAFTLDGDSPAQLFFTVAVEDVYSDSDIYSDAEEALLGTSPTDNDSDFDGIWDDVDPTPTANNAQTSPDTAELPASFYTGLRAYWSFESTQSSGTQYPNLATRANTGNPLLPDLPATITGVAADAAGMISTAAAFPTSTGASLKAPPDVITGTIPYTISFWVKCLPNSIQGKSGTYYTTLFAFNGNLDNNPKLYLTVNKATTSLGQLLTVYRKEYTGASVQISGYLTSINYLDDGKWHHLALTRADTGSNHSLVFYHNGAQLASATHASEGSYTATAEGYFTLGAYGPGIAVDTGLHGSLDRFAIHARTLSAAEIAALYNLDSDHDALADRIETTNPQWRDLNSDGTGNPGEMYYQLSPFIWNDPTADTDQDGIPTLTELADGTDPGDPDTDGDLIPDGWEKEHGLLSKITSDATSSPLTSVTDRDGDGLSNLDEYRYNTNPNKPDTDGDEATDGAEAKGPDNLIQIPVNPVGPGGTVVPVPVDDATDPTDPGDKPTAPRQATEQVQFKLGVGDRSTSHSEDYVLNVFRIDPATGTEQRIHTLRGGGFGQYAEIYKSFKKGETYTFQIQWLGTNNHAITTTGGTPTIEGPDWDYHMVVAPQSTDTGGSLIDSYDPAKKTIDTGAPILDPGDDTPESDDNDNVANFPNTHQAKRVAFVQFGLESDMNNDGAITNEDRLAGDAAGADSASAAVKEAGTEFMFENDKLSNGLWDVEDAGMLSYSYDTRDTLLGGGYGYGTLPSPPASHVNDDDVERIRIHAGLRSGYLWFAHAADFEIYKTPECKPGDRMFMDSLRPFDLSKNAAPEYVYLRAIKSEPQQQSGVRLQLHWDSAHGDPFLTHEILLTVVRRFGAHKYFNAARDYISENNTRLCIRDQGYPLLTTTPHLVFRLCMMREEATQSIRAVASTSTNSKGIEACSAGLTPYPAAVVINGNQCFWSAGWDEGNIGDLANMLGGIVDKCHGRVIAATVASPISSDNFDHTTKPSKGSVLAGPDPIPNGLISGPDGQPGTGDDIPNPNADSPGGKFVGVGSDTHWTFAAGRATGYDALGGLSTNYASAERVDKAHQMIGRGNGSEEGKGIIFTATQIKGVGYGPAFVADASTSGVPPLAPSADASAIQLFILDSGAGSLGLIHIDPAGVLQSAYIGRKSKFGCPYYV